MDQGKPNETKWNHETMWASGAGDDGWWMLRRKRRRRKKKRNNKKWDKTKKRNTMNTNRKTRQLTMDWRGNLQETIGIFSHEIYGVKPAVFLTNPLKPTMILVMMRWWRDDQDFLVRAGQLSGPVRAEVCWCWWWKAGEKLPGVVTNHNSLYVYIYLYK